MSVTTDYLAFDLLGPVKDGFLSAINSALQSAAQAACDFVGSMLQNIFDWTDTALGINFTERWFLDNYERMMWVGIIGGLVIFLAQIMVAALRKDPSAMGRSLGMMFVGIIGMFVMLSLVSMVSAMIDGFSGYIAGGDGASFGAGVADAVKKLPTDVGWFGALVLGLFYLLFGLALFLVLVVRRLAVYIIALFIPVYLAGMSGGWTSQMIRRGLELLFALLMSKLAIVGIFTLGSSLTGAGGALIINALSGVVTMVVAVLCPFAVLYIVSFVDGFVVGNLAASGASARRGAGSAGSAARSAGRAPGAATAAGRAGRDGFQKSRAGGQGRSTARSVASGYRSARSVMAQRGIERRDGGGFSARARGRRQPVAGSAMPSAGHSRHAEATNSSPQKAAKPQKTGAST